MNLFAYVPMSKSTQAEGGIQNYSKL